MITCAMLNAISCVPCYCAICGSCYIAILAECNTKLQAHNTATKQRACRKNVIGTCCNEKRARCLSSCSGTYYIFSAYKGWGLDLRVLLVFGPGCARIGVPQSVDHQTKQRSRSHGVLSTSWGKPASTVDKNDPSVVLDDPYAFVTSLGYQTGFQRRKSIFVRSLISGLIFMAETRQIKHTTCNKSTKVHLNPVKLPELTISSNSILNPSPAYSSPVKIVTTKQFDVI